MTVQAPEGTLEWSPARGFIADLEELTEAHLEGELTLVVEDGQVPGVEGDAPLACLLRVDRQLHELQSDVRFLTERLATVVVALQGAAGVLSITKDE